MTRHRPLGASDLGRRDRRAHRDPARPDPDPVGQSAVARRPATSSSPPATSRPRCRGRGPRPEVVEPVPGRGSVHVRLRGDGTGGEPLLLLSHLDVVPAPPERWTHDPFAADLADGYVYGRGAVDMKAMVAMELGRRPPAGRRGSCRRPRPGPRPDPRPAPRCAVHLHRGRGGWRRSPGADWIAENRPDWLRGGRRRQRVRAACRPRSRAPASTRSRSRRRASPPTGSASAGRGATARCRARTTPRSSRRPSSRALPCTGADPA